MLEGQGLRGWGLKSRAESSVRVRVRVRIRARARARGKVRKKLGLRK